MGLDLVGDLADEPLVRIRERAWFAHDPQPVRVHEPASVKVELVAGALELVLDDLQVAT